MTISVVGIKDLSKNLSKIMHKICIETTNSRKKPFLGEKSTNSILNRVYISPSNRHPQLLFN